ncbi:DUF4293 domain-containing protein [Croceibacter atlanticus]|jgi:hypothetical protein|uniref:Transcription termination factor Rho n=1 Tax=Croceibacter atlanticus (strain ATCC BAA-628 / JCM 21780 / CIP 108009 / IAM 15332 / KCTC 12090 / HTCC2559) TaxID=216432 RepID=A3U4Y0_CROAH|nr:DUF4293 domain-containing protein [Croceibacter atlanticus]EAP87297.1 hypothetical protein CA2559_01040 [Croceibacter atlanticus HTCC2559]
MIQRIQSVYLLLVIIISGALPFFVTLWKDAEGAAVVALDEPFVFGMYIGSSALAIIALLAFKNRKLQFVLGRLNIILNFILLGLFVYWSLRVPGEMNISEKGIGMLLPIISIVFLVLANKAIMRDENLVKSVDRLR